nr:hypothetical protein [Tanacetum cinerariifolium]
MLWEGIHYSLLHSTSLIPYPRFTKIIIGYYMTNFPEISRRARDKYHNPKDDDLMKNIFNSGRYKDKVGMKIPDWMITEAMKQMEHYKMYAEVFRIDVPLIQSQPIESTQRTHRTPNAPRSPNPKADAVDSSAPIRSTMICLRFPQRRSIRLTPLAPVPTVDKADELILQDTLQVSLAEHKSRQKQEARENVALVDEQLAYVEIEKMVEGQENVVDDSSIPTNDEHNIPGTWLEPRSDKESLEVEVTDVVIPVNVYDEEDKITDEVYGRMVKFMPRKSFVTLAYHLHEEMVDSLPTMVDKHVKEQVKQQVPKQVRNQVPVYVAEGLILERQKNKEKMEKMIAKAILQEHGHILHVHPAQPQTTYIKFERLQVPQTTCRTPVVHPRDQDDPHDDAHPEGENSVKWQKISEYEAYVSRESSSGHDNEIEQGPLMSGNQEQVDDYDFWTDSYTSDDDEILTKQVLQDIMEEVSLNIDEAKLKKIADEMLRQRCTSGDEHQYHIDQMKNFLKSDIVWESRKEILKANSRPEKIVLSLHKFHAVVFNDDDVKERIPDGANECIVLTTEPDFKNLNKNDIEDMYLLIMNGKTKLTYGAAYSKLIKKVKKLEHKVKSSKARRRVRLIVLEDEDDLEDPSKQGRKIAQIDKDEELLYTTNVPVTNASAKISIASPEDKTAKISDDSDDITLAETLIDIRRSATKPQKVKGVAFREMEETPRLIRSTITHQHLLIIDPKDKGKGVLVEKEHVKAKKRDQGLAQIESDADLAQRLYEEELAKVDKAQKERQQQKEATIAILTKEFDKIQARIDVDHELAKQLAAERAEAIRNKPPTRTQVDNKMITYLNHIEKTYPLTQEMLSRMLNRRLEVDYESEMAFELLRRIKVKDIIKEVEDYLKIYSSTEMDISCWRKDGYCNRGNFAGAYIVGNTHCNQDLEWYEALMDSELKEEALRKKAIMEGLINGDVESNNEESSNSDDEGKVAGIVRIKTNVFDFEMPLCKTFKEDVLTKDIEGFKTYEEYKDD